jgi:hypothetical protein
MFRTPSLFIAAMLMASAAAFAADTPDPAAKGKEGEAALPSGSNTNAPPATPPAGTAAKSGVDSEAATNTSPGDENKGKPPVKAE